MQAFTYQAEGLFVSAALNYLRALEFDADETTAYASLSYLYAHGLGVARDEGEALRLALEAAQRGDGYSRVYAGMALMDEDIDEARAWLLKAAEDGYQPAYVHLAHTFRGGVAGDPDPEEARRWFEAAAGEGSVAASLAIAYMYRDGEFGEPDIKEAARRFSILADNGSPHAKAALAHLYLLGSDVDRDEARAFALYYEAAEQGVIDAYIGLGYLYETGTGTATDLDAAETWYRRAAEEDDACGTVPAWKPDVPGRSRRKDRDGSLLVRARRERGSRWRGKQRRVDPRDLETRSDPQRRAGIAPRATSGRPGRDSRHARYAGCGLRGERRLPARAIATQTSAIAALSPETESLRGELMNRLSRYEAGEPWRE